MTRRDRADLRRVLLAWYAQNRRDLPWRATRDPYAVLVAEVMLQQTQVERVAPKYREFLGRFPDFSSLAESPTADVIRAWSALGYNLRAVRLRRLARHVVNELDGRLPEDVERLRRLQGVGEYTASAVACFAFGADVPVVDTNVRRVLSRVFWGGQAPPPRDLSRLAGELVPSGLGYDWNQALMELGATVCLARRPRCGVCPVRAYCRAAPVVADGPARVAEAQASYQVERFEGSRRYYRGRIVELLRALTDSEMLALSKLGAEVKSGFGNGDLPWLRELVGGLERDGLVKVVNVGGPGPETLVSLP
ncbi:MAG: A/G-specific adenine glycosylase [Dehalococcoidia bacterium]